MKQKLFIYQTVYDLFFLWSKGKIFAEGENEIDYDIKYEEENYKINIIKEKEYAFEDLKKIVRFDEENKDKTQDSNIWMKYSKIKEGKLF